MAAAREAADAGLSVVILDEQPRAGGQIYRDCERAAKARGTILGGDYLKGLDLIEALEHPGITRVAGASVWQVEEQTRVAYTVDGVASLVTGKRLLVATGALERPMPIPGWTLPGVMTAGAAQILIKQFGMLLEDAVLCGSGPLLYLVAAQMCRAGCPPKALVESQSAADRLAALRHGTGALKGWRMLAKGLGLLAEIRRAGVKRYQGATALSIKGDARAEHVCFRSGGQEHQLTCQNVLLHHGVVPNTQVTRSMGLSHDWNEAQRAFAPAKDEWGRSAADKVFVAGDGAGIGGADVAANAGRLAALEIAFDLGVLIRSERDRSAASIRRSLQRDLAARAFIDRAYPPYAEALAPADETIVCRCEEVTAGDIRRYAKLGCLGPNQAKAFGRSGMGPCQGRFCGLTVTELLSVSNGKTPEETGYYRIRPPIKPVTLNELAGIARKVRNDAAKDAAK